MRISDWSSDVCSSDLHRQFVGEGDVDVAVAVFDQLHHFGGARRGGDAGAAHELAVKGHRAARAARGDAADATVVVDEFDEDAPGKHALGAIGDEDVGGAGAGVGDLEVDRKSVVEGKSGAVRVDLGGRRI